MGKVLEFPQQRGEAERYFDAAIAELRRRAVPIDACVLTGVREVVGMLDHESLQLTVSWPASLAHLTDTEYEAVIALARQAAKDTAKILSERVMIGALRSVAIAKTSS